jgi:protein-disulfide isomerase
MTLTVFAALRVNPTTAGTLSANSLPAAQQAAIQRMIHDYILAHPEVVAQALLEEQNSKTKEQEASSQAIIAANKEKLLDDRVTPITGNLKGNVTMVEFADYQCGYCRSMEPVDQNLIHEFPNLRIVMKDLPILGSTSVYAARVGLVAAKQGKYAQFRKAILAEPAPLTTQAVSQAGSAAGLNMGEVETELSKPWVDSELAQDRLLAVALGIEGTPAFVIGDTLVLGDVPQSDLEGLLKQIGG